MRTIRRCIRIPLLLVNVTIAVLAILAATGWDRLRGRPLHAGMARSAQVFACWSLCRLLGVRIRVEGVPVVEPPVLLVCNHQSWLDILVVSAQWPVSFLSKSEVRSWPGIGPAASALGTLYIERGASNASGRATALMAERLAEGHRVIFFPEGTTNAGRELLPFRPRLYQAAIDAGAPIQPITLLYLDHTGELSSNAPFVDDEGLLRHVIRLAGEPHTVCRIYACEAIDVQGRRRSELAAMSRAAMAQSLGLPQEDARRKRTSGGAEAQARLRA